MVVSTATKRKGCGSSERLRGFDTEPRPRSVVLWPRIAVCDALTHISPGIAAVADVSPDARKSLRHVVGRTGSASGC